MRIVIAGGTGFLGSELVKQLHQDKIVILTRDPQHARHLSSLNHVEIIRWDSTQVGNWCDQLNNLPSIDAVINLCGESIGGTGLIPKKWDADTKKKIRDSRILSSQILSQWLAKSQHKPKVFIQQSGIDFYPCNSDRALDESAPAGTSFLAKLAQAWESSITLPEKSSTRLVLTRTAPILHPDRPPLLQWLWSTYLFGGATVGSGQQYVSWLHYKDYAPIIEKILRNPEASGPYNLCAPEAISYQNLMQTIGKHYSRPIWLHIPTGALQLILGEASTLALDSRQITPQKLLDDHTNWLFPDFNAAMEDFNQYTR